MDRAHKFIIWTYFDNKKLVPHKMNKIYLAVSAIYRISSSLDQSTKATKNTGFITPFNLVVYDK